MYFTERLLCSESNVEVIKFLISNMKCVCWAQDIIIWWNVVWDWWWEECIPSSVTTKFLYKMHKWHENDDEVYTKFTKHCRGSRVGWYTLPTKRECLSCWLSWRVHWEPEEDRKQWIYSIGNIAANTNLIFIGYSFLYHLAVPEELSEERYFTSSMYTTQFTSTDWHRPT